MKGLQRSRNIVIALMLLLLSASNSFSANNKVRNNPGTPLTFTDTGATGGTFALSGTATGTGKYSARYDKGTGPQAFQWCWRCWAQLTGGSPVPGDVIEWYLATSDNTRTDGELGATAATLTTDKRRNLTLLGVLIVDQTAADTTMTASGCLEIPWRYFQLGMWNATSLNLRTGTTFHGCAMTPMQLEIE